MGADPSEAVEHLLATWVSSVRLQLAWIVIPHSRLGPRLSTDVRRAVKWCADAITVVNGTYDVVFNTPSAIRLLVDSDDVRRVHMHWRSLKDRVNDILEPFFGTDGMRTLNFLLAQSGASLAGDAIVQLLSRDTWSSTTMTLVASISYVDDIEFFLLGIGYRREHTWDVINHPSLPFTYRRYVHGVLSIVATLYDNRRGETANAVYQSFASTCLMTYLNSEALVVLYPILTLNGLTCFNSQSEVMCVGDNWSREVVAMWENRGYRPLVVGGVVVDQRELDHLNWRAQQAPTPEMSCRVYWASM